VCAGRGTASRPSFCPAARAASTLAAAARAPSSSVARNAFTVDSVLAICAPPPPPAQCEQGSVYARQVGAFCVHAFKERPHTSGGGGLRRTSIGIQSASERSLASGMRLFACDTGEICRAVWTAARHPSARSVAAHNHHRVWGGRSRAAPAVSHTAVQSHMAQSNDMSHSDRHSRIVRRPGAATPRTVRAAWAAMGCVIVRAAGKRPKPPRRCARRWRCCPSPRGWTTRAPPRSPASPFAAQPSAPACAHPPSVPLRPGRWRGVTPAASTAGVDVRSLVSELMRRLRLPAAAPSHPGRRVSTLQCVAGAHGTRRGDGTVARSIRNVVLFHGQH
jgi:hypothetical protein